MTEQNNRKAPALRRGRIGSSVRTEPRRTRPLARWEELAVPARCDRACACHRRELDHDVIFVVFDFLPLPFGLLVGRANERALDEHMSALFDSRSYGQKTRTA